MSNLLSIAVMPAFMLTTNGLVFAQADVDLEAAVEGAIEDLFGPGGELEQGAGDTSTVYPDTWVVNVHRSCRLR